MMQYLEAILKVVVIFSISHKVHSKEDVETFDSIPTSKVGDIDGETEKVQTIAVTLEQKLDDDLAHYETSTTVSSRTTDSEILQDLTKYMTISNTKEEGTSDAITFSKTSSTETTHADVNAKTEYTECNSSLQTTISTSIDVEVSIEPTTPPSPISQISLNPMDNQDGVPVEKMQQCELGPKIVPCNGSEKQGAVRWFYDQIEKRCLTISDCIASGNVFQSETECQDSCLPKSPIERCLDPPLAGYAQCLYNSSSSSSPSSASSSGQAIRGAMQLAYFDKTTEKCSWFVFLGCGGSKNQFASIADCREICETRSTIKQIRENTANLCQLPPRREQTEQECVDVGQRVSRWYFDANSKHCLAFGFSHCGGTANNFITKSACETFCDAKVLTQEEICNLPAEKGDCKLENEMWFYAADGCHRFRYSGCGGNDNRFISEAVCMDTCRPQESSAKEMPPLIIEYVTERDEEVSTTASQKPNIMQYAAVSPLVITATTTLAPKTTKTTHKPRPKEKLIKFPEIKYNLTNFIPRPIDLEPCRYPAANGNCKPIACGQGKSCRTKRLLRWFFNTHTSDCETFAYSGCGGGSPNNFDSAQSCINACKQRIMRPERERRCDMNPKVSRCYTLPLPQRHNPKENASEALLFAFSVASGTCKAFNLNTDDKNCHKEDYFVDGQECLRSCRKSTPTEADLPNRCFARKQSVTSELCSLERHNVSRWSYLPDLRQCLLFSECQNAGLNQSNLFVWGNNFQTKDLCEATCTPRGFKDVCRLPKDAGPCSQSHTRYYFNPDTGKCQLFMYGGCLGNSNRFITNANCEDVCGDLSEFYQSEANTTLTQDMEDGAVGGQKQTKKIPPVPAEVFEKMRRITSMHTEQYPWDYCLQQHHYGTCPHPILPHQRGHQLTRYFYNRKSRNCEPYTYTGCGARGNHFDTIESCNHVCKRRLNRPMAHGCASREITECPGSGLKVWKFEPTYGTCLQVELCLTSSSFSPFSFKRFSFLSDLSSSQQLRVSNTNQHTPGTFASSFACYAQCLPRPPSGTDVQSICHMNPITTVPYGCRAMVERWYFDAKDGYCRSYVTCPAYGNNFADEETCISVCRPSNIIDVCRLPLDHGGCSQFQVRWYYNNEKRVCEQYYYGGCFGNENRFLSKRECDFACTSNDVCRLRSPKIALPDEDSVTRFTFNKKTQKCEKYQFAGKILHGNNFPDKETCDKVCLQLPNLHPISVKIDKISTSIKRITSHIQRIKDTPIRQHGVNFSGEFGLKGQCLSSPQLPDILKEEALRSCHVDDVASEIAFRYNSIKHACTPIMIFVCLEYPEEPYRFHILGRPLIFESLARCKKTCLTS